MARPSFKDIGTDNLTISLMSVVDPALIKRWAARYNELALETFPRALQWSLMQVARDAQDRLSDEVHEAFDRPVSFSMVRSDDLNRTSVRRWSRKLPKQGYISLDEVESQIYVMQKQSSYFKFALGERIRRPSALAIVRRAPSSRSRRTASTTTS